jgi:hypothetical protein
MCGICCRCGPPSLRLRACTCTETGVRAATIVDVEAFFVMALVLAGLLIAGVCLLVLYRLLRA